MKYQSGTEFQRVPPKQGLDWTGPCQSKALRSCQISAILRKWTQVADKSQRKWVIQGQQGSPLDKECWRVMPAVEAAMSAVSIAQAAAERQCAKAKEAEIEAKEKERLALKKTSEAAEEVARARAIVIEAQQTSAAAAHLRASEEQFAEQAAEKLSQQLSQQFAEQVEVKLARAEVRRAELEENLAELALKRRQEKMQEIQAAQEVAECKMKKP